MKTAPRVTVLMPVYNGEPYISQAVQSILDQTYTDFEFLIIDDGSTDTSIQTILSFNDPRIRLIQNEHNLGQTATLNRGLESARGELVARIDQDDLSHPLRLCKQIAFLDENEDVALLGTQTNAIDANGNTVFRFQYPTEDAKLRWLLHTQNPFFHSSFLFRRTEAMRDCGGYDPSVSFAQDWSLVNRVKACYRIANLPETLNFWRVHGESQSSQREQVATQESARLSYASIRSLGLTWSESAWNRVRDPYRGFCVPTLDELGSSIDGMYELADAYLGSTRLTGHRRKVISDWIWSDTTYRYLRVVEQMTRQTDRLTGIRALKLLVGKSPKAVWRNKRSAAAAILS